MTGNNLYNLKVTDNNVHQWMMKDSCVLELHVFAYEFSWDPTGRMNHRGLVFIDFTTTRYTQ